MIRRAPKREPDPTYPWPSPPKSLAEGGYEKGSMLPMGQKVAVVYSALFSATLILTTIALCVLYPWKWMCIVLMFVGILLGFIGWIVYRASKVSWDTEGVEFGSWTGRRTKLPWSDLATASALGSTSSRAYAQSYLLKFVGGQVVKLPDIATTKGAIEALIMAGTHLPETEETELAKPISDISSSEEHLFKLKRASIRDFALFFAFVVAVTILMPKFSTRPEPLVFMFLGFIASATVYSASQRYIRAVRTWRDNPAFTDPDRPIELLMYDQYGDFAEPLGRFYRHVWANDAKRLDHLKGRTQDWIDKQKAKDKNPS